MMVSSVLDLNNETNFLGLTIDSNKILIHLKELANKLHLNLLMNGAVRPFSDDKSMAGHGR
mgnify:CR=1 FL=1